MTVTATPATIAHRPRPTLLPTALGAGARLHTDEDPRPSSFQRRLDAARAGEATAQALCADAWAARADMVQENNAMRGDLFRAHQQAEAYRAELEYVRRQLTAARPVIEMAGLVAHGHRGVAGMRQAYTTYVEEGPR